MGTAYSCDSCGILMEDYWPNYQKAEFENGVKVVITWAHIEERTLELCSKCATESLAAALQEILSPHDFEQLQHYTSSSLWAIKKEGG